MDSELPTGDGPLERQARPARRGDEGPRGAGSPGQGREREQRERDALAGRSLAPDEEAGDAARRRDRDASDHQPLVHWPPHKRRSEVQASAEVTAARMYTM